MLVKRELYNSSFYEVLKLDKEHKMRAIAFIVESIEKDKQLDVESFYQGAEYVEHWEGGEYNGEGVI